MIKLTKDGDIEIKNIILRKNENLNSFKQKIPKEYLELWMKNEDWLSYKVDNFIEGKIMIINFFRTEIKQIEFFVKEDLPDYLNSKSLLKSFGGEKEYYWGSVSLNIDNKALYKSILIRYYNEIL